MRSRFMTFVSLLVAVAFAELTPVALVAQVVAMPLAPSYGDFPSRWDIFIGYSLLAPHDTVHPLQLDGSSPPFSFKVESRGLTESAAYFFNKHLGVEFESGQHDLFTNTGFASQGSSNSGILTLEPGLIYRFPGRRFTPFVHALAGGAYVDGPEHEPYTWGYGFTAGGGLDYETGWFHRRLAIRIFQADYEYLHANSGTSYMASGNKWVWGDNESINAAKLSVGLVYHIGTLTAPPPEQVTLTAVAAPAVVFAGDPVTVTATGGNLNPKLNSIYSWSGKGVTGNGVTASVATAGLAPGTYIVTAAVKEGRPGKEGLKPGQSAEAAASFTVKQFEPPTLSLAANPATIKPEETSTITATGVSPQNRPLTYSYSSTGGTVAGSGATATFNSAGAPTGAATITGTVTDDKGQTATATAFVTITAPYVAPLPHTQALSPISFSKDKARPARVDNEAKAVLDEVALDLQKQPDAKAMIVGEADASERTKSAAEAKAALTNKHIKVEDLAAQRAVNAKYYLVTEKGIDAARIGVATGTADSQTAESYLVPAGAEFNADVPGTTPVDESSVKPQARKPLAARKRVTK